MEKKFADGIRFERPKEGSPEFVKGRISIQVDMFVKWVQENKNDKGWVNLDLLKSKEKGTLYLQLDNWKKPDASQGEVNPATIDF